MLLHVRLLEVGGLLQAGTLLLQLFDSAAQLTVLIVLPTECSLSHNALLFKDLFLHFNALL